MSSLVRRRWRRLGRPAAAVATVVLGALLAPVAGAQVAGARQPVVPGATQPGRRITFADALQIALRQNVSLLQARNTAELGDAGVRQARMQFVPNFNLSTNTSTNLGRNFNQAEGRIINQTSQSLSAGVSSGVTLFNGFQNTANLRAARADARASDQTLERTRQTVVFTVASDFLTLLTDQEQLRVQQENLASLEALQEQIQRFVSAGSRPVSDLYQQQAQTASARVAVVQARQALELAKVQLIQTLQLDPTGSYEFVPPVVGDERVIVGDSSAVSAMLADSVSTEALLAGVPQYDMDSLLTRAFAQRADLAAQQARLEAAQQDIRAARGSRYPSLSMSVGYNSAYTSANDLPFFDQFDQRRGGSVGFGVSLPIFDRGNASLATQQAEIQAENAQLALAAQRQTVALEVRRAFLDYQSAQEQLVAAAAQKRAADLAVSTTQERYRVGAATLVEVTQSRAAQVQAASAYVNARYNLIFQQSLMSYYTGELEPNGILQ